MNLRNGMQEIPNTFGKLLRLGWSKTSSSLATSPKNLLITRKTWHQQLLLRSSTVVSVGPSRSSRNPQLVATKIIAIPVILCWPAHRNNSNYPPLLIALYVYSAGLAWMLLHSSIILFHRYPMTLFKKKLRNITSTSTQ